MRKPVVIIGVLAVAGLIALNVSAFTGTGLKSNAGSTQFVGGTISQSVTRATLESIVYSFSDDPANTTVNSVALTFADEDSDGLTPTIIVSGGGAEAFTCNAIAEINHLSTCTTLTPRVGVTGIAITVAPLP